MTWGWRRPVNCCASWERRRCCESRQGVPLRILAPAGWPGVAPAGERQLRAGIQPLLPHAAAARSGAGAGGLLEVLHRQDPPVIHRDIKPENLILLPGGGLGPIDFGTARQYTLGRDTDTRHLGTRTTAAPEQYGYAQTDVRADLYVAGATLLWLAAGAYDREALSTLPRWLERTLERAMAFDPADRWPSAADMERALARKFPWKRAALDTLAACAPLLLCGAMFLLPG